MDDTLRIGVITSAHGIHGEVKVFPTTDDPKRFSKLKEVLLETKSGRITLHIKKVRFFKNLVILQFDEYDNINQVETFRQCDLLVTRENAVPLEEGEYFLCDIMDADVLLEDGTLFGQLKEVLQTGANDVYVVKTKEGKEVLLPVIPQCVLKIDTDNKQVIVKLMDGLME